MIKRRSIVGALFALFSIVPKSVAITNEPRYQRIKWIKLEDEPVGPGDFWVSHNTDPNTPERQSESDFNLQLQAINPSHYGTPAKDIPRNTGDYWRPVGLIDVY